MISLFTPVLDRVLQLQGVSADLEWKKQDSGSHNSTNEQLTYISIMFITILNITKGIVPIQYGL